MRSLAHSPQHTIQIYHIIPNLHKPPPPLMQQRLHPAAVLLVELHSQLTRYVTLESDVKHLDVVLSRVQAERHCAGELKIGKKQCGQSIEN